MTAINAYVQTNTVSILTDGLLYDKNNDVVQVDFNKCVVVDGMRCVVAATGPAGFGYLVAEVAAKFSRFDDLVAMSASYFDELFAFYARQNGYEAEATNLVLAGWLERESRPAAFIVNLVFGDIERLRGTMNVDDVAFTEVTELPTITIPAPDIDKVKSTGWPLGIDRDARDVKTDLLHVMEIQRRQKSVCGKHIVVGKVMLTSVTADNVTQRVVHCWPEDQPGELIRPRAIDWQAWRMERQSAGLSRLKRERMLKKMAA